jgi:CRISPR/Cas system-associated endonuclease/helicase Cas3
MASNLPATLRRLHELPGSAIFVDESHAALPVKLLPTAWRWMNIFADEWSCYWVLASGSLCRFWQIAEITQNTTHKAVPEIVSDDLRSRLEVYERNRVSYKCDLNSKRISELIELVNDSPGRRLVILNTVQSAAVLAYAYSERFGRECTEHLSTALTPNDRDKTLGRIKERLKNKNDVNWTLFATSCVEAGVNLSFRRGFREIGSLVSLLQLAGRVNREGDYPDAEVWTFILEEDEMIIKNTGLNDAANILRGYFEKNMEISPDLSTRSVSSEIRLHGVSGEYAKLLNDESIKDFPSVQKNFTVIESDTSIAVVDSDVAELIRKNKIDWKLLQRNSVQIKKYKLKGVHAEEIFTDIYHWKLGYNDFLGYMAGIIENNMYTSGIMIV